MYAGGELEHGKQRSAHQHPPKLHLDNNLFNCCHYFPGCGVSPFALCVSQFCIGREDFKIDCPCNMIQVAMALLA